MKTGTHHGGDVFAAAASLGLEWTDILDYSASINPLGPPPGLKEYLFENFSLTGHYPDPYAMNLRRELAEKHKLVESNIMAGNGTTALMYLSARVLRPKRPVIPIPAFAEYEESLVKMTGVEPVFIPCREEDQFRLTMDVAENTLDLKPDLVYLSNPVSPAGLLIEENVLELLLDESCKKSFYVILDEAFLDFCDAKSFIGDVAAHPNLIVMKSMTKFYALPGLRLGYLAASHGLVARLLSEAEPWAVNSLALAAASYCVRQNEEYEEQTRNLVKEEREWLTDELRAFFDVLPGRANYLLMKISSSHILEHELVDEMKKRGVLIRGCSSFQGIMKNYVRVAVKGRNENEKLVQAFKQALSLSEYNQTAACM